MPEGQFLGKKGSYLYSTDSGIVYVIQRDQTLATLPGTDFTPATDAAQLLSPTPRRFGARGVHWQGELGSGVNLRIVRKFIICFTPTATLYASDVSQTLTIDGVAGFTTGKRGETLSFARLAIAPIEP
jgi:hypothetical protein